MRGRTSGHGSAPHYASRGLGVTSVSLATPMGLCAGRRVVVHGLPVESRNRSEPIWGRACGPPESLDEGVWISLRGRVRRRHRCCGFRGSGLSQQVTLGFCVCAKRWKNLWTAVAGCGRSDRSPAASTRVHRAVHSFGGVVHVYPQPCPQVWTVVPCILEGHVEVTACPWHEPTRHGVVSCGARA